VSKLDTEIAGGESELAVGSKPASSWAIRQTQTAPFAGSSQNPHGLITVFGLHPVRRSTPVFVGGEKFMYEMSGLQIQSEAGEEQKSQMIAAGAGRATWRQAQLGSGSGQIGHARFEFTLLSNARSR
jgi:hypothetical protein